MKTRDRILHTSLELFNVEGEEQTTTIDIANEMDISPGNLYYHFKGKDDIISELFHQYETAISSTLTAPIERPLGDTGDVEDNWYFLYVVLEEMYQYRFLYHNLDNILQRYPSIRRHFKHLIQLKRAALFAICQALIQQSVIDTGKQQMLGLVDNMTLNLTFWLSYDQLFHEKREPSVTIHQGVLQLLTMVAPYLGDEQLTFYRDCELIYAGMLEKAD
ncbi:TetR/AcrR family transcriptional regulator [Pseudohalioglobus lutimaris]|uniref:TetR family transcriptional regulator n=1 Tax=Pseudohalioglobus lutimaris TaxID=1737061 RepID=A0A2N5WZD0_9GAMM|nr:TetR/AcrR family transcriptional regulator [Pseudohalioglobus lutimaris]PLW67601.1 TetR family transcriptional regulator [Pseudohalioglobus lutimaris]